MKELTIKEKAKAYDEAIERAKDFMNGKVHYALKKGENIMCWVFPELRESEDERIRQLLLSFVKYDMDDNYSDDFSKEDYIAWLEKQGEKKHTGKVEPKKEDTSELTPFEAELFSMMSDAWQGYQLGEEVNIAEIVKEHSSELLERANKQNPTWSEEDEKISKAIINRIKGESDALNVSLSSAICWIENVKDRIHPKLQQEWSEEDNTHIHNIIGYIGECKMYNPSTKNKKVADMEIAWLKSLKDRVQPQLKQEWSEEDEKMKNAAIMACKYMIDNFENSTKDYEDAINWLKSLKPGT